MYKLAFFVPETALETVKTAVFATGAGQLGHYAACCFQTRGEGQFRPIAGAKPYLGSIDRLERVVEFKVELVCEDDLIRPAIEALRRSHPYEAPAFDVWRLSELDSLPPARSEW